MKSFIFFSLKFEILYYTNTESICHEINSQNDAILLLIVLLHYIFLNFFVRLLKIINIFISNVLHTRQVFTKPFNIILLILIFQSFFLVKSLNDTLNNFKPIKLDTI